MQVKSMKSKKTKIQVQVIAEPSVNAPHPKKVRASKMGKWRALVLVLVHVLIALHIAHWWMNGETITPVEPSEAIAFSRGSIVNAGLIFFASAILITAFFGRFFCGWACHLLALQDFCRYLMMKIGITPRPLKTRILIWVPSVAFFYMFVWPLVYRIWIGDSLAVAGSEFTTSQFWATFPGWIVGGLTFLICGFATVYFLGAKGFCTYACPYGAAFAAVDRIAPMRIRVTDACEQCGHCTAVCSSNVRVHEEVRDFGMVVSAGCMKCQDCISVCPKDALYYGFGPIPALLNSASIEQKNNHAPPARTPIRWLDELILVTSFVFTFLVTRNLYGVVPFLMALGLSGIVAFLVLTSVRLTREATVERSGLRLKRNGKILLQGRFFIAVMSVLLALFLHSAMLRYQMVIGDQSYYQFEPQRRAQLQTPPGDIKFNQAQKTQIEASIVALNKVRRWGLFTTAGNDVKLAWLYALINDASATEKFASHAIQRNELAHEMYQLLALQALAKNESEVAVQHWQRAIEWRPELPEAYLSLGIHYANRGELDVAQTIFDHGLASVHQSAALFYNAGLARALQGQNEASIAFFESALRIDDNYLEARENLAGVLAALGRFKESVTQFRTALQQSPDDIRTRMFLVRALLGQMNQTEAAVELNNILKLDPSNTEARQILQQVTGEAN